MLALPTPPFNWPEGQCSILVHARYFTGDTRCDVRTCFFTQRKRNCSVNYFATSPPRCAFSFCGEYYLHAVGVQKAFALHIENGNCSLARPNFGGSPGDSYFNSRRRGTL